MRTLFPRLIGLCLASALAACGGGGGSSTTMAAPTSTPTPTPTPTPTGTAANFTTVTLDAGPAALNTGPDAYTAFNEPYVSVTICAPGSTTNCQTIDHIILDTGSVGLRIIKPVIDAGLMAALPTESDSLGNPVGECYKYVNSYAFGSVRQADFAIGGEKVANMPFQAIGDTGTFATAPSSCSSGGGTAIDSVQAFGANGIIGVGTTTTDCGTTCQSGLASGAGYYDCPASGCSPIIARNATATAPFQQLPNPVAAFATDNNGTLIVLPSVPAAGVATLTGTVYFGIGTQADNALTATTILPTTTSASSRGPGFITATYNGKALTQSFLDTGSNDYYFIDTTLPICTQAFLDVFYCPAAPTPLSPVLTGTNNATGSGAFTLYNPATTTSGSAHVAPGLGVNPTLVTPPLPFANSFDFGIPFFFGKNVYTAIEGRTAGSTQGPYFAW